MLDVTLLGASVKARAQLAGEGVVVLAIVCSSRDAAERLVGRMSRTLERRAARHNARTPVTPADTDPFPVGAPARLSTYAWDRGEMSIDVTVVRRVSVDRLVVRTKMGVERDVDVRDLERGQRAS